MSARDRIIALLRTHPDGLDDDVIAEKLGLSRRQQANSRCRELERDGIVERRSIGGKIQNLLTGNAAPSAEPPGPSDQRPARSIAVHPCTITRQRRHLLRARQLHKRPR